MEKVIQKLNKLITNMEGEYLNRKPNMAGVLPVMMFKKRAILDLFDGDLILEKDITVPRSGEMLIKDMKLYRSRMIFENVYENALTIYPFMVEVSTEDMIENKLSKDISVGNVVVPKGMKFSRALKFFFEDKEKLNQAQTDYSRILNQKELKGKLCLSIHPLDYMTMSHNTYNWRSCMALDGEYRAGVLSYMMDNVTIVAYLKSSDDKNNKYLQDIDLDWNSKRWRQVFYVEPSTALVSGKGYPFHSDELTDEVFSWLESIIGKQYADKELWTDQEHISYTEHWSSASYVDLDRTGNNCYVKMNPSLIGFKTSDGKSPAIEIGGEPMCPCCLHNIVTNAEALSCDDCCEKTICEYCECSITPGDEYILEGDLICGCCYDEFGMTCESCFETYGESSDYVAYYEETDQFLCECCSREVIDNA